MQSCSVRKRKLNYTIHNPNTVEETAKVLLDILIQANEGKVERKIKELGDYYAITDNKNQREDIKCI